MSNDQQQIPGSLTAFDTDESLTEAVRHLATATEPAVESTREFGISALFETLSYPGRRYILTYLLQSEGYVTCSELVDNVVSATEYTMTEKKFRKRVSAELAYEHLPKLEDQGLLNYNLERQMVSPTDSTALVRPYLRLALAQQHSAETSE